MKTRITRGSNNEYVYVRINNVNYSKLFEYRIVLTVLGNNYNNTNNNNKIRQRDRCHSRRRWSSERLFKKIRIWVNQKRAMDYTGIARKKPD